MARESFVWRDGKMVDKRDAAPLPKHGIYFGAGPGIISDSMPTARHMASGRMHDSKSAFRRDTKSYGCVEVGNDAGNQRTRGNLKLPDAKADVAQAWAQIEGKA